MVASLCELHERWKNAADVLDKAFESYDKDEIETAIKLYDSARDEMRIAYFESIDAIDYILSE